MKFYISDLHLGHANAIKFDHRPFDNVEQMDKTIIDNWNARVTNNDEVYIIGDFAYKGVKSAYDYLVQLKGKKYLVIGNHDSMTLDNKKAKDMFVSTAQQMAITDGEYRIQLSHFPMAEWNHMYNGTWHIYGHIHNTAGTVYHDMIRRKRALNAGCMITNWMPVTFKELIECNKVFQESVANGTAVINTGGKCTDDIIVDIYG